MTNTYSVQADASCIIAWIAGGPAGRPAVRREGVGLRALNKILGFDRPFSAVPPPHGHSSTTVRRGMHRGGLLADAPRAPTVSKGSRTPLRRCASPALLHPGPAAAPALALDVTDPQIRSGQQQRDAAPAARGTPGIGRCYVRGTCWHPRRGLTRETAPPERASMTMPSPCPPPPPRRRPRALRRLRQRGQEAQDRLRPRPQACPRPRRRRRRAQARGPRPSPPTKLDRTSTWLRSWRWPSSSWV
jgi:hypothetical protein